MSTNTRDTRSWAADWIRSPEAVEAFRAVLRDRWTPAVVEARTVEALLCSTSSAARDGRVTVLGQREGRVILIEAETTTFVISPWQPVRNARVLEHLAPAQQAGFEEFGLHCGRFPGHPHLPLVFVVNMAPAQFTHRPSLALGVGMVAGAIERAQCARVRVFDLKLGVTASEVLAAVADQQPDVVGAGVDFGEKGASIDFFRALRGLRYERGEPLLVAGNYLAYISARELLAEFPDVLIARGEGERFILDAIEFRQGRRSLRQVSGAIFRDPDTALIVETELEPAQPSAWALPSRDTVPAVIALGGSVTLELSRGCPHVCTFCPRSHKTSTWRGLAAPDAADWIKSVAELFDSRALPGRKLYLVDEEFIGYGAQDTVTHRLADFARELIDRHIRVDFEFNTRVDQVLNSRQSLEWHLRRWAALRLCRDAGLKRILLGVESGSDSVLKRFRKGHDARAAAAAIRVLSSLDIGIRATFINYDPLMSLEELDENRNFLARRDVLFRPLPATGGDDAELFHSVHDTAYAARRASGRPLYSAVTYLHNSLKILSDSAFAPLIARELPVMPESPPSGYRDPRIGIAAVVGETWMLESNGLTHLLMSDTNLPGPIKNKLIARIQDWSLELIDILLFVFGRTRCRDWAGFEAITRLRDDVASGSVDLQVTAAGILALAESELDAVRADWAAATGRRGEEKSGPVKQALWLPANLYL